MQNLKQFITKNNLEKFLAIDVKPDYIKLAEEKFMKMNFSEFIHAIKSSGGKIKILPLSDIGSSVFTDNAISSEDIYGEFVLLRMWENNVILRVSDFSDRVNEELIFRVDRFSIIPAVNYKLIPSKFLELGELDLEDLHGDNLNRLVSLHTKPFGTKCKYNHVLVATILGHAQSVGFYYVNQPRTF